MRPSRRRSRGFSLLEILVAFAIMAIALGMLYRVMGNNIRQAGQLTGREHAMMLAESLLAAHQMVPPQGVQASGEAAGFGWQVQSAAHATPANNDARAARLHELRVDVQWVEDGATRSFALASLRPERLPLPGESR